MRRRLLTITACLVLAGPVVAQSESHVPIPRLDDVDPATLFAEKLRQAKLGTDLGGLMQQLRGMGGDMSALNRLLEANPQLKEKALEAIKGIDFNDPKFSGLIDEAVRRNGARINPEIVKQQLQNLQRSNEGQSGDGPGPSNPDRSSPSRKGPLRDDRSAKSRPAEPAKPRDPAEEAARQAWARDIADWASRFPKDKLAAPLRDSPALNSLLKDLTNANLSVMANGGEGLDVQLARMQQQWESVRDWLPGEWPKSLKLSLPDIGKIPGNVRLPDLTGTGAASRFAAPALGTLADILPVLCVVAIGIVVLVVIRRMRVRSAAQFAASDLGPWPVDPSAVSNRNDLIRAFDYLSQLRCGPAARAWHHRAVAAQLGHDANALADLYEQARYAPDGELPPPTFVDARSHLTRLAGTPA